MAWDRIHALAARLLAVPNWAYASASALGRLKRIAHFSHASHPHASLSRANFPCQAALCSPSDAHEWKAVFESAHQSTTARWMHCWLLLPRRVYVVAGATEIRPKRPFAPVNT